MNKKRGRAHGAAISAPPEEFAVCESPSPGAVAAKNGLRRPPGRPLAAQLLAALKLAAGLIVVVGAAVGVAMSVHRYARTTTRFALKNVELVGAKRLTSAKIEKLAGLEKGKNLFSLDTEAAELKILEDPWVASVRVLRELPATLRVELTERDAAAIAAVGEGLYLVTSSGEPFKTVEPDDFIDLPIVTGVAPDGLARDRARAMERLRSALDLIKAYEKLPASRVQSLEEVHLEPSGDVSLTVGKDGVTLELGQPPFARKLSMADQVLGELRRKSRSPGIIFLDNQAHPERVVVRMK